MTILSRWFRRRVSLPNSARLVGRRSSRVRLFLEPFEDRWVPASLYLVTTLADGLTQGTLRFAITQPNANNTGTAADPDLIQFATGGTISVIGMPLPALTDVAVLDATTAPGYAGTPVVTLDGTLAGLLSSGLTISSASSTVKGFEIISFSGHGIRLDTGGGVTVVNNSIGFTSAGVVAGNGANGILVSDTAGNVVGGTGPGDANVVSGNGGDGILIVGPNAAGNRVVGNFLGTDTTGTLARGNAGNGVRVATCAHQNTLGGNVISGNGANGVLLGDGAVGNTLSGNFIGTNLAGTAALGNALDGVALLSGAANNLIGDSDSVTGVTYYDATAVGIQPVTAWQGIRNSDTPGQYLLVGSSGSTGLLFDGSIAGVGASHAVNYPGAATTSVYGPDNLTGTAVRLVGTYKTADAATAAVRVHGFLFEGTTTDLTNSANYRTIDILGAEFTYVHSTMGGLAVGNSDSAAAHGSFSLPLGPGHAFLYDVATAAVLTDIVYPGSLSNTAYGIWSNGGTSYTICGGWSPDPVNNFDDPGRPFGLGYIVDYDAATGAFTNWASFEYPDGKNFVTHFEGISSVEKGVYTLNADSVQRGSANPVQGSWVSVRRNADGSFGRGTWVDLNFPTADPTVVSSSNSVYGNQVVGLAIGAKSASFQATVNVGFQLSNVIAANGGNGVGLYGATDNQVAMNFIGTDVTGTADLGNAGNGVLITAGAARNQIGGQATGGNDPTAGTFVRPPLGNLISANDANGVLLTGAATMNVLSGNFIGTAAAGVSALGNALDGVAIEGADGNQLIGCTVRQDPFVFYNVIGGNGGNGLRITDSDETTVQANFFGIGADNATAVGNVLNGVLIEGSSANTQLGGVIPLGNVVAGNLRNGVEIRGTASGTVAFNTFNGLPAFSDSPVGNALDGFLVTSTGGNNLLRTNVISGNRGNGIHLTGDATGVQIAEDIMGMNTNGQLPMPNGANGVLIDGNAHDNTVGGFQVSVIFQNTISANGANGIAITGNAANNTVFHSYIGIDIFGLNAFGNGADGIFIGGNARGTVIGGVGLFEGVLVSGNLGDGIRLTESSTGTVVIGSLVGSDRTGLVGLPNQRAGIAITASNNRVGGTAAGEGNVIAFNAQAGVGVAGGTGNAVLGNSIFATGGPGIDLTAGGNQNQPAPALAAANYPTADTVQVAGVIAAAANTTYRVEFFAGDTPGQGRTLLGFLDATTDATGRARFTFRAAHPAGAGTSVTATATDPAGNTSEFSSAVLGAAPIVAVGAGPGGAPAVGVFNADGSERFTFLAFDAGFTGGVRVAVGHIDGRQVIVAAAGPGGGPNVRVFDATGHQLPGALGSFFAYDAAFTGGVFVAVGDVDGDGSDDIVTGAGAGGGPNVKVFSGRDGRVLQSFFAYAPSFAGGVSVAVGYVNGDAFADVVTGAGAGGGPRVVVFDGTNPAVVLRSFFAFDAAFLGGVYVAAGNLRGGATDLLVVGAGAGGGPQVNIYDGLSPSPLTSFLAYDAAFTGGVRVAVLDADGDGSDDIVTGAGPGGGPQVNVGSSATRQLVDSFFAFDPAFPGGVFVGGG
ncbi:MAG TPA: right-handed parallel beta-helix repeat-containing protein [Urbifossiella sp.]|nr:right-handed parallel beta-helix repeat-containing protein [Urbifossiella sp.]